MLVSHEWVEGERTCQKQMSAGLTADGEMKDVGYIGLSVNILIGNSPTSTAR